MKTTVKIVHSWIEYRSLPDWEWRKDYFSWTTGGYVATNWKRIEEANKSNQEKRKFDKEHQLCLTYAKEGHHIKHLVDRKENGEGTYDTIFDNIKADLKRTRSTNNIIKYAHRAIKKQGAQIILFEFERWNNEFRDLVDELVRKGYHGRYVVTGENKSHLFKYISQPGYRAGWRRYGSLQKRHASLFACKHTTLSPIPQGF